MKQIIINNNDASRRLDSFLRKVIPKLPETLIYKYLRKKRIKINGKKAEGAYRLQIGDILDLYLNDEFFTSYSSSEDFKKAPVNLDIIYEDTNIILINKKPGLVVHSGIDSEIDCLINRVKNYLFAKGEYNPAAENSFTPALANRIDRNTGGIVIAAKNYPALTALNEYIKAREIDKTYLCIVCGIIPEPTCTLTAFIEKDSDKNKVYIKASSNKNQSCKKIITKYKTIATSQNLSLLEVELITGRTHQIRAHMAFIGYPILGDGKYGQNTFNRKWGYKYQALYSYKLKFNIKDEAGPLYYLNGKEFKIDKERIWFVKDFYERLIQNISM